ncbi:uncharacterized protein LOC119080105 [Bradysia coprophila]|uniref:uncharacterized protein LOC119080105 n=1 Tax=Bradysia coprophila TaxID=38358 RepID=UPI00187D8DB9|nr:uncharacterized protein LOC119080105 [Bradysia coprophila]
MLDIEMKTAVFVTLFVTMIGVASAYISCSLCNGAYVNSNLGSGCVAAVREKCAGLRGRQTSSWKRGVLVKSNCNSIPSGTAIATFEGPGATFASRTFQHAAIFIGCAPDGIKVHDQWVGKSGCSLRTIKYSGYGSNGGNNFYTIV